ncbi:MerR family transcriptional regulator [Kribbella deserti]|uniref:MerR family transcriptional regulator n=1 Tax=Kribbella deserti TaxID=1926257 RepID=A0ABV6QGN8_9ACTN
MSWSISEVARVSGVTTRTLRHYDAIGLLPPDHVGANGYRYYERPQLLRLQRILLLRELGLGLPQIEAVLAGSVDEREALRLHREEMLAARDRLDDLLVTIDATIAELDGGPELTAEELFAGFDQRRAELEERLVAAHGEGVRQHFAVSAERTREWTAEDHLAAREQGEDLLRRMALLARADVAPDSPGALELIGEHHLGIRAFWEPDRSSYVGLAEFYLNDPEQRSNLDRIDPLLAPWLHEAMTAFAASHWRT